MTSLGGAYGMWSQQQQHPIPMESSFGFNHLIMSNFPNPNQQGRSTWKPIKVGGSGSVDQRKGLKRKEINGGGGYKPPRLKELQSNNRLKAKRFYPKKFGTTNNKARFAPHAPRNTSSFIIRAKKSGGIASLVSPSPVTPAVLPTPIFSPSREALVDTAKEEWGVDGYGSMNGLIRLRSSPGNYEIVDGHEDVEEEDGGSSDSDLEEHVEMERRLDQDLSRFEMIYPNNNSDYNIVLESRVNDQDTHIAHLEEENLTLKERLFLVERELGQLRQRLQFLERGSGGGVDDMVEEVVENSSENNENEGEGKVNEKDDGDAEYGSGNERHDNVDDCSDKAFPNKANNDQQIVDCKEKFVATEVDAEQETLDAEYNSNTDSERIIGNGDQACC
ncbi:hypothetical protein RJ641_007435 [Dillenia turbinata]|uniref:PRLI-interacting factor A n=1 Tax=Dillenia turbinata TaxID=194707 RepID=A0AAN8V904_9MAGN